MPITQEDFDKVLKKFDEEEQKAPFFQMARDLVVEGKSSEATILLLATWNFAAFRYLIKGFDINRFEKVLKIVERKARAFEQLELEHLEQRKEDIVELFNILSKTCISDGKKYNSIGPTGASKILHLFNPKFFIMWDSYIRGEGKKAKYRNVSQFYVEIGKGRAKYYPRYTPDGNGYFEFIRDMKELFLVKNKLRLNKKSWAKAIDEFNFVKVSMEFL